MFPRVLLRSLSFLVLLCLLLAGPAGSSAYVFCIGSDGHAGFEPFHAGDCQETAACSVAGSPGHRCDSGSDHDAPCTDIHPSITAPAPRNQTGVVVPASLAVLSAAQPTLRLAPAAPAPPPRIAAARSSQSLLIQRVTVLRC